MKTEDVINILKTNKYSFELKENQVIIRLARKCFFKLYIEDDTIMKYEDILKQYSLLTYGKSLKVAAKIGIIYLLIFIVLFAIWCFFDPYFFSAGGKYFFIVIASMGLFQLIEFWYHNKRLSKIKKLLNINE